MTTEGPVGGVEESGSSGEAVEDSDVRGPQAPEEESCDEEDICTGAVLRTDRCAGATALLCTANDHDLCATATCGGQTYACTQQGNQYAWRLDLSCDDGEPCTYDDVCSAGVCSGTPVTCEDEGCVQRECNGTSTCTEVAANEGASCDDGDLCTYDDACSAGVCAGTPVACAGGACVDRVCNGTSSCTEVPANEGASCDDGDLCTFDDVCSGGTCGGTPLVCEADGCTGYTCDGTSTCVPSPLTGPSCNDGNLCTHNDRCDQGVCLGTPVACVNGDCLARTCNGTSSCTETPFNLGNTCDDFDGCTVSTTCQSSGVCGGGVPADTCGDGVCNCGETHATCPEDCPFTLPPNACVMGSQSRDGCGNARVIGRSSARSGWSSGEQGTCSARNRHSGECSLFDVGFDHTYVRLSTTYHLKTPNSHLRQA